MLQDLNRLQTRSMLNPSTSLIGLISTSRLKLRENGTVHSDKYTLRSAVCWVMLFLFQTAMKQLGIIIIAVFQRREKFKVVCRNTKCFFCHCHV